jgi:hypothetical protein
VVNLLLPDDLGLDVLVVDRRLMTYSHWNYYVDFDNGDAVAILRLLRPHYHHHCLIDLSPLPHRFGAAVVHHRCYNYDSRLWLQRSPSEAMMMEIHESRNGHK